MTRRPNATVVSGYVARDGRLMHFVRLDGHSGMIQCEHPTALPEFRRVIVADGKIIDGGAS